MPQGIDSSPRVEMSQVPWPVDAALPSALRLREINISQLAIVVYFFSVGASLRIRSIVRSLTERWLKRVSSGHGARGIAERFMGSVGGSAAAVAAVALSNLFWAGLWLTSAREAPTPVVQDDGCSAEERCLDRVAGGARYQLVLELGGVLAWAALAGLALLRLPGRCCRRRSGVVPGVGAAVSVASPAALQASSRRPAGAVAAPSVAASAVVAAPLAASAAAAFDIATPREAYVPRRLRQKSSSP